MGRRARVLLALAVVLALIGAAAGAINVAGSLADVWDRLRAGPPAVFYGLILFLAAIAVLAGWLVWTLLVPRRGRERGRPARPVTESGIRERLEEQRALGLDVSVAERELRELARRREEGRLYLCLCGEISTGKSSLVKAMAPGADGAVDVLGGTTTDVVHYRWRTPAGDEVVLADVPGTGSELDEVALAEAVRAHVVIYVTDGDLTRSEFGDLRALMALGKPLVLALNKSDRYSAVELEAIAGRLGERIEALDGQAPVELVTVSAGGAAPDVDSLKRALQRQIGRSAEALDALRDGAVFELVAQRLDEKEAEHRKARAAQIVRGYTRKAVVGALAAISPGTDVLIQGYLGTGLVRELCELYGVPAKEIDVERLLKLSQGYVGRSLPILLAVAGNALKAFPGVGTIAGGLTHAVAYGLIFDALGNGLSASLEEGGGELRPAAAARKFQENLGEDLGARTVRMARLALEEKDRAD